MKNKTVYYIFIFFNFIFLSSCASLGKEFTGDFKNIKINSTTRKEIENSFGFPFKAGIDSGLKTYQYAYIKIRPFIDPQIKELTVRFNENDTVHGYSFYSSFNDDQKIIYE